MNMKRVKSNTKLFVLFALLLIIILGLFIYFLVAYIKLDKNVYNIEEGSVLYTDTLQYIKIDKKARIEEKINGIYYLYETEGLETKKYKLGKSVIVSKSDNSYIDLYGKAYQVLTNGNIVKYVKNNKVAKANPSKIFKLDDRKYLMVDSNIVSKNDSIINTKGYLYVEIDKNGNATFANDKLSFKTINPIILSGAQFEFDIANEKLKYDKEEIDLKTIIGSSNKYEKKEQTLILDSEDKSESKEKSDSKDKNKSKNKNTTNNIENQTETELDYDYYDDYLNSIITSVNNLAISLKNANDTSSKLISQKTVYYDFNKWVALKSAASTSSSIDISYSVFDPNSEYDVVFVRLTDPNQVSKTFYLNKNNTIYSIGDLKPDTEYNLEFGYKTNKSNKEEIADELAVSTVKTSYDLNVTKIKTESIPGTSNTQITIFYDLKVDSNYRFKTARLVFTSNGNELANTTLDNNTSNNSATMINSEIIGDDGIYHGKIVLAENVTLNAVNAENVLSLEDVVICSRENVEVCSIDPKINLKYKFYSD